MKTICQIEENLKKFISLNTDLFTKERANNIFLCISLDLKIYTQQVLDKLRCFVWLKNTIPKNENNPINPVSAAKCR